MLRPNEDRERDQVVIDVAKRMGRVPGIGFVVEGFLGERIHETLSGDTAPVVVKVIGPDMERLRALAGEVGRMAAEIPGLGGVRPEPQIDIPQIRVRPDRTQLARYGVRPDELASQVVDWRQGRAWTQLLGEDGRVVDVVVAGPLAARTRAALAEVPIDTPSAGAVNLGALATIDEVAVPALINHDSGERRISIGIDVRGGGLSSAVTPVSHGELVDALAGEGMDRTTVYRNLVDLTQVGLVQRTDLGDHVWRFELRRSRTEGDDAKHPHFTCSDCG